MSPRLLASLLVMSATIASSVTCPRVALAADAGALDGDAGPGDAGPGDAGGDTADAGADAADTSSPSGAVAECPLGDVGRTCQAGTCVAATCYGDPATDAATDPAPRDCAVCVPRAEPGDCLVEGAPCDDGGVCQIGGGAGGQPAIAPDGAAESVYYGVYTCQAPATGDVYGASGDDGCDGDPYACGNGCTPGDWCGNGCNIGLAPLRRGGPVVLALGASLAVTLVAWRRRRRSRPRRRG